MVYMEAGYAQPIIILYLYSMYTVEKDHNGNVL